MRIQSITLGEGNLPLYRPFTTALRSVNAVNSILVRIEGSDGRVGYGEAPPTAAITGETKGSIRAAIEEQIGPSILGHDLDNFDEVMAALHRSIVKNTSAKAAVDMALYDLLAQDCGKPLFKLLGGARSEIETDITISLNDTGIMVRDSVEAISGGFHILKVKVGKGGAADADTIAAIRDACPTAILRVDANQGWSTKQAIRAIRAMEDKDLNIELVEQPVPAHDVDGLRRVTQAVDTPVLADEAVFSVRDATHIITTGAADLINIKLMKTGGIYQAVKICGIAEEYGVRCMMGCMLESKIAVSAAAHLACGKGVISMADLDGPTLCTVAPYTGGPDFCGPHIRMSNAPGIGISHVPAFA